MWFSVVCEVNRAQGCWVSGFASPCADTSRNAYLSKFLWAKCSKLSVFPVREKFNNNSGGRTGVQSGKRLVELIAR